MNQVYFIHLVLARLGLRQAFEVTSNVSLASSTDSSNCPVPNVPVPNVLAPNVLAPVSAVWMKPALQWGLAIWITASSGCVGTRIAQPPNYNGCDFQPPLHQSVLHDSAPHESAQHHSKQSYRLGLFGSRLGQCGNDCYGECSCAMTSGIEEGLTAEEAQPQPRESLTLPWLREGHRTKPPEVSRFLPVPTRPVFEPQAFDW